jgi:hypothetical protein
MRGVDGNVPDFPTKTLCHGVTSQSRGCISCATDQSVTSEKCCVKVAKNLQSNRASLTEIMAFKSVGVYLGSDWELMTRIETPWWAEVEEEIHRCQSKEKWGTKGKKRNELYNCRNFC